MNFGYPFTPYAPNIGTEAGYMGNVGVNTPNMTTMPTMDYTQPNMGGCGCGIGQMQPGYMPTSYGQSGCNQVVQQTCAVDMPYYVNYNTHAVSNLCYIKWSKNAKKVPKSVQNGVFLDKNCNFSPFTSSVYN